MPLVNFNKMLSDAQKKKRAVAAINIANIETLTALVAAAEETESPIVIQVYHRLMSNKSMRGLAAAAIAMASEAKVEIAFHLDHGASLDQIRMAVDMGFSSVMLDGSNLPFQENVAVTTKAVEIAHEAKLSIEGEIGQILSASDDIPCCNPEEAIKFAEETRVDALAAAVGSAHGSYKKEPSLSFEIMDRISAAISVPLVLHGGTGIPDAQIRKAIAHGVAKVNIATEFQNLFLDETRALLSQTEGFRPLDVFFGPVTNKLKDYVKGRIELLRN